MKSTRADPAGSSGPCLPVVFWLILSKTQIMQHRRPLLIVLLVTLLGCGDGGNGRPSIDPPLAYVLTECSESAQQEYTAKQMLMLRRGDADVLTIAELPPVGPVPSMGLCKLWGQSRSGIASVITGAFQRLGMSPDGSLLVFEVEDHFSIASRNQVPSEQEGIFVVRTDGSGMRRIGDASRNRCYRVNLLTANAEIDPGFAFSPDGSSITFTDIGPGPSGERTEQVFTMDLATGTRRQVTRLPPAVEVPADAAPLCCAVFLDADTITFHSRANPVVDGEELNPGNQRRLFSVKNCVHPLAGDCTSDPQQLRVAPSVAEPGSKIIEALQITGPEPVARAMVVPGEPVNGPGTYGNVIIEAFVFDAERILQLTGFRRSDTTGALVSADRQRISFYASADPLGRNPFHNCQLFSIDRTGRDLRQLTNFSEGTESKRGCAAGKPGPGCTILTSGGRVGPDPATGSILFTSNCDPFDTNPNGDAVFAIDPDGTNLRQLTHARGFIEKAGGSVTVEFPGPAASPLRAR